MRSRSATAWRGRHVGTEVRGCVQPDALVERSPSDGAELLGEHGAEPIVPRDRQLVDDVGETIEVGRGTIGTADAQRDPRQRAGADERLEVAVRAAVGRGHGLGDELGEPGGEPGAREVHEHGRPGADRFGDVEDPHELAFLQPDDVDDEVRQPIGVELEHEVAGKRLERVADRPSGVCLGAGIDEPEHGPRPIANRRDRQDALSVGARREQTDETVLQVAVAHAHTRSASRRGGSSTRPRSAR